MDSLIDALPQISWKLSGWFFWGKELKKNTQKNPQNICPSAEWKLAEFDYACGAYLPKTMN